MRKLRNLQDRVARLERSANQVLVSNLLEALKIKKVWGKFKGKKSVRPLKNGVQIEFHNPAQDDIMTKITITLNRKGLYDYVHTKYPLQDGKEMGSATTTIRNLKFSEIGGTFADQTWLDHISWWRRLF